MEAAGPRNGHSSFPKFFIASAAAGATLYWLAGKSAAASTLATQTTAAAASTGVGASLFAPCQIAPATFVATPVASTGFSASLLAAGKTFALAHPYIMVITAVAIGIFCLGKGIQMYQRHQAETKAARVAAFAATVDALEKATIRDTLQVNLEDLKTECRDCFLNLPTKLSSHLLSGYNLLGLQTELGNVKNNIKTAIKHYPLGQENPDPATAAVHAQIAKSKNLVNQFEQMEYLINCRTYPMMTRSFKPTYPELWNGRATIPRAEVSKNNITPTCFDYADCNTARQRRGFSIVEAPPAPENRYFSKKKLDAILPN